MCTAENSQAIIIMLSGENLIIVFLDLFSSGVWTRAAAERQFVVQVKTVNPKLLLKRRRKLTY
jgi:hypothetical protein